MRTVQRTTAPVNVKARARQGPGFAFHHLVSSGGALDPASAVTHSKAPVRAGSLAPAGRTPTVPALGGGFSLR